MTTPGKIIAFPPVAVIPRPPLAGKRRFEGFPRFARAFASPAPLVPDTAKTPVDRNE